MLALWKKIHDQPAAAAKSLHSCPTLCDPKDGSPSGFPIPGIIQERTGVGCHFLLQCMKVKSESEVTSSFMTKLDSILKSRDITLPTKVCLVKAMVFSNGHVWMWELDYEESWVPKNWCFWTVVLEKTLQSPLDCKEIQSVHSEGDQL